MDIWYIYYKRYDSVFYILVSGVIVLIMVLSLNVMCRFIFLLCSYFYYLFMGLNKKYFIKCIVNGIVIVL